ncbi:MAG: FliH/SctL family protein [Candidatus Latescibacterota bacterium]|nr:FliH/SctL family protein [Candidatus Latescibacterota bacterium]
MNHVLRSPDISETPFVIPIKSGGPADVAEDEGNFQSLDVVPEDEQESLEIEDAAEDPNRTQDSSRDEAAEQEVRLGADEKTQSGQVNIERDSNEDSPQTLTEEEDEVMIGLEEVAEGDATMVSGSETSDSETTDGTSKLPKSAGEIEALVEARLKEFEDRFQQEKEDAYHAGFEAGKSEGTKQGLTQSEEEIERFQSVVGTLTTKCKDTLKTYDMSVTELAIQIAQKIISVEIDQNEEAVLQAVHDCLGYVEDKTKVIIRVNPNDLEAVRRHRNDWLESLESMDHLLIESEPSVSQGGCVVETPIGDVDAQIEERLERLRNILLEEINRTENRQDP